MTPTPETQEDKFGPVQLGRFINGLLRSGEIRQGTHDVLGRFVIAWRDSEHAREAQVDMMSQSYHTLSVAYNATCKRLEAAEKEIEGYRSGEFFHRNHVKALEEQRARIAALAVEEKPNG